VFTLLCLAIHLSIQTDAQERAELLVQAWAKKADVKINNIRYHLLRNALILKDIHAKQGNDSIAIKHILLRTSPESLNNPKPHIGQIEISGIEAEFHRETGNHTWQQNQQLMNIWQATSSLHAQNGHIKLYLQKQTSTPLILNNISIQQHLQSSERIITASANLHHGTLQWQLHTNRHNKKTKGTFNWQHLNTQVLTDALALSPMHGYLNGELTWRQSMGTAAQQSLIKIEGKTRFSTENSLSTASEHSDKKRPLHRLRFSASQHSDVWNIDIETHAWPLAAWSGLMPTLAKQQVTSAQIDGASHWQGKAGAWDIDGSKGVLHDIVFASPEQRDGEDTYSNTWSWYNIKYNNFNIDTKLQRLHVSRIVMNDGKITLNTAMTAAAVTPPPYQTARPVGKWNISIDNIRVRNLTLLIKLPDGDLILPSLAGQCSWPEQQPLAFNLASRSPNSSSDPQWRLHGNMTKNSTQQLTDAEFFVHAKQIPITSMRPLLPLQINANSPVTLTGNMNMQSNVSVQQGIWRMQGKASAINVQVSHAGDIWMASHIDTTFGPVGMDLDAQNIDQINVEKWSYIAALEPLQAVHQEQIRSPVHQPAWWSSALRNKNIYIHELQLHNGAVSMGQKESLWAEHFDIQMNELATDSWANVQATAEVGGGRFELSGEWTALSEPQRFIGSASLQHALPFFLHSWMSASGMPRFVRGYLDAQLDINPASQPDSYLSTWQFQLLRALPEATNSLTDPMLTRTGLNTHDLIQHLGQDNGLIKLQGSITGLWTEQPLNYDLIGHSFQRLLYQEVLRQDTAQQNSGQDVEDESINTSIPPVGSPTVAELNTQIRLHDKGVLSLNERSRLFKIVRFLRTKPDISIDLIPHWSGNKLSNALIARILRTQDLIKRYMVHRNIDVQRIFPRWPVNSDHAQEISSIQVKLNH